MRERSKAPAEGAGHSTHQHWPWTTTEEAKAWTETWDHAHNTWKMVTSQEGWRWAGGLRSKEDSKIQSKQNKLLSSTVWWWGVYGCFLFFQYSPHTSHYSLCTYLKHFLILKRINKMQNSTPPKWIALMILNTYFFELISIFSTTPLIFSTKLVNVIFSKK